MCLISNDYEKKFTFCRRRYVKYNSTWITGHEYITKKEEDVSMKKRFLSVFLALTILVGITLPALNALAETPDNSVKVAANTTNNITIEKEGTLPEEPDYNGVLEVTAGKYEIERNYSQACTVSVKNNSAISMEYYLTVSNIYDDIYLNFVRSGSVDIPLVIKSGETQRVQLDVFAQNATRGSYTLPIYAYTVTGSEEKVEAKATAELVCPVVSLNVSCTKTNEDENTLAQTYLLKNLGEALTDVTVSVSGDAEEYTVFDPIIGNYQMNRNASVTFKTRPDLTKMKNNNVTKVTGKIVVYAGGKSQSFDIIFDTQGQKITSTTMGELAQKQEENQFFDLSFIKGTDRTDGLSEGTTINYTKSVSFMYNTSKRMNVSVELDGTGFSGNENDFVNTSSAVKDGNARYIYKTKQLINRNEYKGLLASVVLSTLFSKVNSFMGKNDELDNYENYVIDYTVTISDSSMPYSDTTEWLTYFAIAKNASSSFDLMNPTLSEAKRIELGTIFIANFIILSFDSSNQERIDYDATILSLDDAKVTIVDSYGDGTGLSGCRTKITFNNSETVINYLIEATPNVKMIKEGLIESTYKGKKCYLPTEIVQVERGGLQYNCLEMYIEQSDSSFSLLLIGTKVSVNGSLKSTSLTDGQKLLLELANLLSNDKAKKEGIVSGLQDINDKVLENSNTMGIGNKLWYEATNVSAYLSVAEMVYGSGKAFELTGFIIKNDEDFDTLTNIITKILTGTTVKDELNNLNSAMRDVVTKHADEWLQTAISNMLSGEYGDYLMGKGKYADSNSGISSGQASTTTKINGSQCTNAGQITTNVYIPQIPSSRPSNKTKSTQTIQSGDVSLFITSRMYGGDGVNRWYGNPSPEYVDIQNTTYTYKLNGVSVGTSQNSGVTDVAIVKLPVDNLRLGATNTIICDYETNPGHYFVNTDTEISLVYSADMPISYIGSPESLQDVRSLPDFAIYSENIFGSDTNIIVGNETAVSMNIYNRGSMGGWFNISVSDGKNVIYSESNHYLDAFTGDKISFNWTPAKDEEDITVTLTNTSVGLSERSSENNTATRTFRSRQRTVPVIDAITPDYAVVGEGIVFATISKNDDVIKTEFYIDDVLYTGEVKSSAVDGKTRSWINDPDMSKGEHTIKVLVTYATGTVTTAQIEKSATISVLDKDWDKYTFELSTEFASPRYYLYDVASGSYSSTYSISRNGSACTYTITKQIYDNLAGYYICVSTDKGFVFKQMSNETCDFELADCNTLTFTQNSNLTVDSIYIKSFDSKAVNILTTVAESLYFTPAIYTFSVEFTYLGESRTISVDVDLTAENKTIDLSSYITKYVFNFNDAIAGSVNAKMYYKNAGAGSWSSFDVKKSLSGSTLTCIVPLYNSNLFENAEKAFICITTNDAVFVTDIKPISKPLASVITLDKSKLQKYTLSANGSGSDFDIFEVKVSCEKFTATLYSPTVYLTPGEYDIVVLCKDGSDVKYAAQAVITQSSGAELAAEVTELVNVTVEWPLSYLENNAYVYGNGNAGNTFSQDKYSSGTAIAVEKDNYVLKTNIVRNNSYYSINSTANASSGNAKVTIGDSFNGKITNTFGTCKGNSTTRIYLDKLLDENGNELTYFNSQSEYDNLSGYVTLTNVSNPTDTHTIYVSLSGVSSFDITLPNVAGTYSIKLEVSTSSEVLRTVNGIGLGDAVVTLKCGEAYQIIATVSPTNATNPKVIWTSSNEKIATVDENGVVTASKYIPGTVDITATTEDGAYSATVKVTVKYTWWQWALWAMFGGTIFMAIMIIIF